ncbi:MAG: haloalkane dehalogenase [Polyangiaceae bacterium]|nr:haloalkane dehalogenase [Polyangiaceae bacterium]MCB9605295.1 haloalkane dehalogenase [Polyangiaceae bacterium]
MSSVDLDDGPGHTLVFLHGNPTSSYLWRNVIPWVRGSRRIVAPDLIGMGASGKPAIGYRFVDHARYLEHLLDALNLDRVVLITHDWGTALALDWWSRHPTRVRGIVISEGVLASFPTWAAFPQGGQATFRAFRAPGVGESLILDSNTFIEHSLPGAILRSLTAAELAAYRAPFPDRRSRLPLLVWPRELPIAGEPEDVVARLAALRHALVRSSVPKLLLTATPGALIREPFIDWCRSHLPNLEIHDLGQAIHYPQEDQPDAFGRALARWLNNL